MATFKSTNDYLKKDFFLENKYLVNNSYTKYFIIKAEVKGNKESIYLSNSYKVKKFNAIPKPYLNKFQHLCGYAFTVDDYTYQHEQYNQLGNFLIHPCSTSLKRSTNTFSNAVKSVGSLLKKGFTYIIFKRPTKGGFLVSSVEGIAGFLPRREFIYSPYLKLKKFLNFVKNKHLQKYELFWLKVEKSKRKQKIFFPLRSKNDNSENKTLGLRNIPLTSIVFVRKGKRKKFPRKVYKFKYIRKNKFKLN
jgi:hypothetical protein